MTGNDVVDMMMAATESNWQRKGFVEKIFTCGEQAYILATADPFEMLWKLWSMKESAYKLYVRQHGGRFFAPQKFCCTLLSANQGLVTYNTFSCQTITHITTSYVYSIASKNNFTGTDFSNNCFDLPQTGFKLQQQFIYQRIVDHYKSALGFTAEDIFISKDKNGIPFLKHGNHSPIPVSITHHGRFAAFIIN